MASRGLGDSGPSPSPPPTNRAPSFSCHTARTQGEFLYFVTALSGYLLLSWDKQMCLSALSIRNSRSGAPNHGDWRIGQLPLATPVPLAL